jgi:hypothetical protein
MPSSIMKSRTLLVELNADSPQGLLQPGAYAEVEFELPGDPHAMLIPASALLFREHGLKVATVDPDNKVELKTVTRGRNLGTQFEVLSGLSSGSRSKPTSDSVRSFEASAMNSQMITTAELKANARKAYDDRRLTAQHGPESAFCLYLAVSTLSITFQPRETSLRFNLSSASHCASSSGVPRRHFMGVDASHIRCPVSLDT